MKNDEAEFGLKPMNNEETMFGVSQFNVSSI